MGHSLRRIVLLACAAGLPFPARPAPQPPRTPADLFGELYARVEEARLFPDSKSFADAVPRGTPAAVMGRYRAVRPATDAALRRFVAANFALPPSLPAIRLPSLPLAAHIAALWPLLTRPPIDALAGGSALSLAHPYVVPGGRFREIYYWDSYFTMLGLLRDGRRAEVAAMVANFADLIGRYGHIPNGSRTYYLSRSQPPVFYLMAGLAAADPADGDARYLAQLKAEHAFWMRGAVGLAPGEARGRVVRLADGTLLNRYWDDRDTPRDESYAEDVALAKASGRPGPALFRDLRAGAESGWDFSSRWLANGRDLRTIETTQLVPIDLNCLLVGLERAIAAGSARRGDQAGADAFARLAAVRTAAIKAHLWNGTGAFEDLDRRTERLTGRLTAATLMPLFTGVADPTQAHAVARTVRARLLRPGGLATTIIPTGQQWDEPNGWAPLQWIAVAGLDRYGEQPLADTIAARWVASVSRVYACTGRLVEKYDVDGGHAGGGGEYAVQDGFGWTNGVTRALLDRPAVRRERAPDAHCISSAT